MSDIVEKLRGYNPPDRTIDEQRQIAVDIHAAADEIARLRAEVARKDAALREIGYFPNSCLRSSGPYDACETARAALTTQENP